MTADRWREVDRLYHAALERSPETRPSFLDHACAGDDGLRREVESLLQYQIAADRFLERPALQDAAERLADEGGAPPSDPEVAGYSIVKTLGEGGMGIVYLAEQMAPIRRQVALKLIKRGMDSRQVVARFEGERQALALMHHPHIASVFDAGTTTDGRPYFVMEYVDGVPITTYCDRHRLSMRARLELFTDVCAAVQHAHQKGVIHRDLKPSNVLVSDQDGRPMPKIIDFGIAKATAPSAGRLPFTEQGMMVGTPEYMSPEQAALSTDIDTTTDVYSLGVLLYELLVGALPFDAMVLRERGYDEMRRVIRESDPPKPSSRLTSRDPVPGGMALVHKADAGRLTRQLKGDLDWITLKALEKDRRQRYTTVAAFAADVGRFLADRPVEARPPSPAYRMRKFARRYRGAVAAAAAVLVVLVAGLSVSIEQYFRAESQRAEADRERSRANGQRDAANAAATEAAQQRNGAVAATAEAERQRLTAIDEAAAANEARREAEYREYVATIGAADNELRLHFPTAARERLLAVPVGLRGWEWYHLFLKTDSSLVTLTSPTPCARPYEELGIPFTASDNAVVVRGEGAHVYFRRCAKLDVWDAATYSHVTYQAAGKILAIGPAGDVLVTIGSGTEGPWDVLLVDPASGRTLNRFGPFQNQPMCADVSSDGTRIAVGLQPQLSQAAQPLQDTFETWDVRTERRLARLAPPKPKPFDTRFAFSTPCELAFSPDSTQVASSGATVHVWRADSGGEVASDATQAGNVSQPIAWSSDGSRLAVGRLDGLVEVLNLKSALPMSVLDGNGFITVPPLPEGERRILVQERQRSAVLSVAFSPDGARIVTGTDLGVGLWDLAQGKLMNVLIGHDAAIIGVAVALDGRIVSGDASGKVRVWPPEAHGAVTVLHTAWGHASHIGVGTSRDGTLVGVAQLDGEVSVWHLPDLRQEVLRIGTGALLIGSAPSQITSMVVTPGGRQVLAGEFGGTLRSWTLASQQEGPAVPTNQNREKGCEGRTNSLDTMVLSADGRSLAFAQGECAVVRDWPTLKTLATLRGRPTGLAFRPDGSLVLVNSLFRPTDEVRDPRVMIWDWRADKIRAEVPTPPSATPLESRSWKIGTSADGRRIALSNVFPALVSIWDGNLAHELCRLPVPPETRKVAFSPDGRRIATSARDDLVRIWDTDRCQLLLTLTDDDQHEGGLAFTPDGRLIAGRSAGGLTIWDSQKREPPPHDR